MAEHTSPARPVFLSYAREDAESVRRIADALRAFGVEVWFDQNELRGGDAWDQKIRGQIRTCTLCVPVISATTQSRGEGYFRREWKLAADRTHDMAGGMAFLLPVVIDATAESDALVPEEFMRVQWTRLPQGVPTPQFVEQVKHLLENPNRAVASGRSRPPQEIASAAPAGTASAQRKPAWTAGAVVAIVVGIATAVWVSSRRPEPAPATPAPASVDAAKAPDTPSTRPLPRDKSVAVLPFANMSEDKEGNAFFSDGIHEDILTNLALIRELRVVSRTSVMGYRNTTKAMKDIAQELGVTYILEGSVRRVGNKVRVTGQLIHAATDEHVWAQAYDRDLTDVFTIQAELSQQIAGAMKAALSPEEKVLIARKPTENAAAYDLYLRARDILNRDGPRLSSRGRQIELLEQAVALDPKFAVAWSELASTRAYLTFSSADGMEDQLARAKVAMERALALAPDDPEVITNTGTYYYYGYRDYVRAVEYYERLARLQPNSPVVFNSLGLIQRRQGRWAQSLANFQRTAELEPSNLSYLRNLGSTQRHVRRWDEAIATQQRIAVLLPDSMEERALVGLLHFYRDGSQRELKAFFDGLTPSQRDSSEGIALRKGWARVRGDWAEGMKLDKILPYDPEGEPRWEQAIRAAIDYYCAGDAATARARLDNHPADLRERLKTEPRNDRYRISLAMAELILGNKPEALRCADQAAEILPESLDALDGVSISALRAGVYDLAGDKEVALAEYARLLRTAGNGNINVHELRIFPSTLRGDPRYEALLNDPKNNAPLF